MTKHNVKDPIAIGTLEPHGIAAESFTHKQGLALKVNLSFLLDLAHLDSPIVLDRWQAFGKTTQTDSIARSRDIESQSIVRTNEIVLMAESLKTMLKIGDVLPLPSTEQLSVKRAVKPFILAHGLRVIRPAVTDRNLQPDQPHGQLRIGLWDRTVV